MKISNIETFVVRFPNESPYMGELEERVTATSAGYFRSRGHPTFYSVATEGFLVKITTDDGTVGWGEAQAPIVPEVLDVLVQRLFKPFYIGADPFEIDALWSMAYDGMKVRGHVASFTIDAMAACDIALWDIVGKASGNPVHELMGGALRDKVRCYVSGLDRPTIAERAELAVDWVNKGYGAIKMALGFGVEADLDNLRVVREAVGADVVLMNDAHWHYSVDEAMRLGQGMEGMGCYFLEAPIEPEDLDGLTTLTRDLQVDIAMGEERRTQRQFIDVLERGAANIIQPDVGRTGLSGFRKIAALAETYGVPVIPHLGPALGVYLAASIHAAACIPDLPFMEFQPSIFDKANSILKSPIHCSAGHLTVPTGPGLGIEVDEAALAEYCGGDTD